MNLRKAEIVQYYEYLPGYPDNVQNILEQSLDSNSNIKNWAYIIHDKDIDNDGNLKPPHIHLVMELRESVSTTTIGGYVGVPQQYVQKIKQQYKAKNKWYADVGGALSYLTHRNAPNKHQYSDDEVIASENYNWIQIREKSEQRLSDAKQLRSLFELIEIGVIRKYNITEYVTMQQYIDMKKEINAAFEYRTSVLKNNKNRNVTVIYISGESGAGKTVLAKEFCNHNNLNYCISGSSRDPAQDYEGQPVLILDDLRPNTFPFVDLLKILDNNTASSIGSRYHDKWLEVEYIIITSVFPFEKFYFESNAIEEPIEQLKRRCKIMVELSKKELKLYVYRVDKKDYELILNKPNPVLEMFTSKESDISEQEINNICLGFGIK